MRTAKRSVPAIGLLGLSLLVSSCAMNSATVRGGSASLTKDEKHRLYAAALAASDSPLDTQTFKRACQRIGVFDEEGQPNDKYIAFVTEHFEWSSNSQGDDFRGQISTREKAQAYIRSHLPQ